jgi:hypothetical protein
MMWSENDAPYIVSEELQQLVDDKMRAAVLHAAGSLDSNGLPVLTSDTVKLVFKSPAWSNPPGYSSTGLRYSLPSDVAVDIAWSWLVHAHGTDVTGNFERFSRGGDRSTPMDDWRGRGRRTIYWHFSFDNCGCAACCDASFVYHSLEWERLHYLERTVHSTLNNWADCCLHDVWRTDSGVLRLGHSTRSALWCKYGSSYRELGGAETFSYALLHLVDAGLLVGDVCTEAPKQGAASTPARKKAKKSVAVHAPRPIPRGKRRVLLDLFSGFQSLLFLANFLGYDYVPVDISAVLHAGASSFSVGAGCIDLSLFDEGCIVSGVLGVLGLSAGSIAYIWCSPPCRTFTPVDATNSTITKKRKVPCNFRDHSHPNRPPRKSLHRGDKFRALAVAHDKMVKSLILSLLSCCIPWSIENPFGSLARRPYMSRAGFPTLVNYCAFVGSYYHKPTHLWNSTLLEMMLPGFAGSAVCGHTAASCNCGHINTDTGNWNHDNRIAGSAAAVCRRPGVSTKLLKNCVPTGLQLAVAKHFGFIK